ncbi:chloride channel protein CLC-e isoform X2 [Ziziphus jujuba]|uniref:Chloride channel protein n=1 Tax=Ziziphus jujuba TaxID=326968 RepID=A0A6P6GGY7_ZIZJJ|nr:chloride channel protein CLC-e isoform X2 [Ziziphus jujuba]
MSYMAGAQSDLLFLTVKNQKPLSVKKKKKKKKKKKEKEEEEEQVHELRDYFWDGIPYRGASWLREGPIEDTWKRVILVPTCGGLIVSVLNVLRSVLDDDPEENDGSIEGLGLPISIFDGLKAASRPFLKAVAACVTLGTGNSLGPEGPNVEIGTSIAKGVGYLFNRSSERQTSIVAAGSAAGIASGFNAAVAGCFFAVESVLWPSPTDPSSLSLSNTTSMVILSAVIASVVSEVGLGSEPAFKVPVYDFRSPTELPLYLLLGILCGLVSLALSRCTSFMLVIVDKSHKTIGIPRALFPILGGLCVGLIALPYPEILYWGFQNVDILLESRPFVKGLSADLLLQLVAVKIIATSLCRASGLVGGYYAPSLFIGAATGVAYGKLISFLVAQPYPFAHISFLEVASPQAYGLVGMAATLAGVCQVPLTAVLLLFELTQDYRIVLPLLGAVGLSSWITSGQLRRKDAWENKKLNQGITRDLQEPNMVPSSSNGLSSSYDFRAKTSNTSDLCEIESSLCVEDSSEKLGQRIYVSEAMKTRYVTIMMNTLLTEAVTLMLIEKQPCAMIVDNHNVLVGLLTLRDIQEFSRYAKARSRVSKELLVSEMCSMDGEICRVPWVATPSMNLLSAQMIMNRHGMNELPVVIEHHEDQRGHLVGLLDRECISLTCRAVAARESLS